MASLWEETWEPQQFPSLTGHMRTHTLVIGGGMAGVLCAYFLHQAGVPYVLVEADRLCSGITKNTTAKITSQHGLIYHQLVERFGLDRAQGYLHANQQALEQYRELCSTLDCDFQAQPAYVYDLEDRGKIEEELHALDSLGHPATFAQKLPLPFPVAGAVCFPNQAQFHPLQFVQTISKGLNIFEHTPVRELVGSTAVTDQGRITADHIIVATHFPPLSPSGMRLEVESPGAHLGLPLSRLPLYPERQAH